jgi:hypothetical protein
MRTCLFAAVFGLLCQFTHAAVILDSQPAGGPVILGHSGWNTLAQKFTLGENVRNVSIDLFLAPPAGWAVSQAGLDITRVWLVDRWGPGATTANVLAYTTLPAVTAPLPSNPIFSLPVLAAGNYAVIMAPGDYKWPLPSPTGWWWNTGALPGSTNLGTFDKFLMAGISSVNAVNKAFVPASSFQPQSLGTNNPLALRVSGDIVPEPASLSLLVLGGLVVLGRRRR